MNPMKILLVDDSKSARYALRLQLQRYGAVVEAVESAEAALDRVKEEPPDAIFMDHTMPGMNGFEALEILKSNPATTRIPVVMCTSHEDPEFIAQALRKGALGILSKATAPNKLPGMIEDLGRTITKQKAAAASKPEVPDAQPAPARRPAAKSEIALEEAGRLIEERLEERIRTLLDPMVESLAKRLSTEVATKTENTLQLRLKEERSRLEQHFAQIQGEQVQLASRQLENELLPSLLKQHLTEIREDLAQQAQAQLTQERQHLSHTVQELVDASVDRLADHPSFLRRVLEASEATAANCAEEVVKRQAHQVAETVATERAGEVADSLIRSAHQNLRGMYFMAAGAAAAGIAAAVIVYVLLR